MGPGWKPTSARALPLAWSAARFAERNHAGQRRSDGAPFILHPLEVASLLDGAGAPDHLIAAGFMHDLLEKSEVSEGDLQDRFGPEITALVLAVTEDESISGYAKRKAALRRQVAGAGEEALTLFAADKLSKLRELRREGARESGTTRPSPRPGLRRARRLTHYRRSLAMLEERLPESSLVREMQDELEALTQVGAPVAGP